jgi:hypothetical protein
MMSSWDMKRMACMSCDGKELKAKVKARVFIFAGHKVIRG